MVPALMSCGARFPNILTTRLVLNLKTVMKHIGPGGRTTHSVPSMIPGVAFATNPILGNIGATLSDIGADDDEDDDDDDAVDTVDEEIALEGLSNKANEANARSSQDQKADPGEINVIEV